MTWSGAVEPDYFQFYAKREGAEWLSDVTDDVYRDHLWTDGGFVVISTVRKFGTTPITLDVVAGAPGPPGDEWQQVVEVSLEAGGRLEILSWPGDQEPRSIHDVPAGPVRLRVQWAGLVPDRFEGMDDDGNSEEHIAFVVWPAPVTPPSVLRVWSFWPR